MKESALMTVCAWCSRVRDRLGDWRVRDLPEEAGRRGATHGICPDCLKRATARATMVTAAQ